MKFIRPVLKVLLWSVVAILALDLIADIALGWTASAGGLDQTGNANCLVVPSGGPGYYLGRVQHAVSLFKQGKASAMVLSRGHNLTPRDQRVALFLQNQKVPDNVIYWSIGDRRIGDVLAYTRKLMFLQNWKTCMVCTDPWEVKKTLIVAKSMQMDVLVSPATESPANHMIFYRLIYIVAAGQDLVWYHFQRLVGMRET